MNVKLRNLLYLVLITNHALLAPVWASPPVVLDRLEGYVNDSPILLSDIEAYRKTVPLRSKLDPLFSITLGAKNPSTVSNQEIIEFMINDRLTQKEFPKSDAETEQEVNLIQTNNHIDRDTLVEALKAEGVEFSDYFELIREATSKKELVGREIQTKVNISDDDVKNYFYNQMDKSHASMRSFHLQLISIHPKNYKSPADAQRFALETLKQVQKATEPFEEIAKRVSDDASSTQGGDLGIIPEDQLSGAILDQAKKLKIGEISPVFNDPTSGRHLIIKLVDLKTSDSERYQHQKEEIRGKLLEAEYERQVKLWVDRKREAAVIHMSPSLPKKTTPSHP